MAITVGIPSKGVNQSTLRVVDLALSLSGVSEILVTINPGIDSATFPAEVISNQRVIVTFHQSDLGLYGNFRYLVQASTSEKFMWLCTDDSPSSDLDKLSDAMNKHESILAIPTWCWAEYRPDTCSFDAKSKRGVYPPSNISDNYVLAAINPEPSWIFGLWDTKFLRRAIPKYDFDWLDVHLLQQALLSKKVLNVDTESVMTIGTWNWANKKPYSISNSGPYSLKAVLYQLWLLPKFLRFGRFGFFNVIRRIRSLIHQSKQLRVIRSQ